MEKTCNGGYCDYKIFGNSNCGCSYEGYCDFQTPRDSRTWGEICNTTPIFSKCRCSGPEDSKGNCKVCLCPKI